ncbi:MAG: HAD-IA family hydrolase [Sphingomonadales bacterium]|nr:HAD-IA family hydrolase [Sphingomonadales bacterium]
MANRLALFDCDGTLVDSQHTIFRCVEIAFARAGLPSPGRVAARRVVGLSLLPAMRMLAPGVDPGLHIQLTEDYKAAFQKMRGDGLVDEPLFDGIVDALDALEADGWILGVATGKSDRGLDLRLRHHGLRERFVTLQTADRHPSKPHPSMAHQAMAEAGANPETTVMIGDTSFDMVMGVAAGAGAIGVDWGYHPGEETAGSRCEPDRVARTRTQEAML